MDNDVLKTTLSILIGGVVAILPAILGWVIANKKLPTEAKVSVGDAADKVSAGYDRLVENLQERLDKVENRLALTEEKAKEQECRIVYLENGIRKLVAQLKEHGLDPVFTINGVSKPNNDLK